MNLTYEDAVYCGGVNSARVRVRIKKWNQAWIAKHRAPEIPRGLAPSKCARCGMIWDGPMGYCCPEGNMCGMPRETSSTLWPYPNVVLS